MLGGAARLVGAAGRRRTTAGGIGVVQRPGPVPAVKRMDIREGRH